MSSTVIDAPIFHSRVDSAPEDAELPPLAKPDWKIGLKLTKHHFQAQDRYHEDLVRFSLRLALGDPWGITHLAIDEDALAAGQFVIRRLSALFPDGTPVVNAKRVPPRAFDPRGKGDVYIALPMELPERAMVAASEDRLRYVAETAQVTDYNTGRDAIPLGWSRPNLRIVFEGESLDGMSAIRIARLGDPLFVPPVLRVGAAPLLRESLERIAAAARSLVREPRRTSDADGAGMANMMLNATLGRLLPALHGCEDAHPREAHRGVAALLGALSAFSPAGAIPIPQFDFNDLEGTFASLEAAMNQVVGAILAPTHWAVPLLRHDENTYHARLQDPGLLGKDFLLVMCGGDAAALHANIPHAIKVVACEELGRTIEQRLAGVPPVSEVRRPHGLAVPPQSACFRLDKRGPAWGSVVKHGTIAIWLPTGFTHLSPMLIVQEPGT